MVKLTKCWGSRMLERKESVNWDKLGSAAYWVLTSWGGFVNHIINVCIVSVETDTAVELFIGFRSISCLSTLSSPYKGGDVLCWCFSSVLMYQFCADVSVLCWCISSVLMCQFCADVSVLCWCISSVLMFQFCADVSVLCWCISSVLMCQFCADVSVLCWCIGSVLMYQFSSSFIKKIFKLFFSKTYVSISIPISSNMTECYKEVLDIFIFSFVMLWKLELSG
jgi:hypothetical protein